MWYGSHSIYFQFAPSIQGMKIRKQHNYETFVTLFFYACIITHNVHCLNVLEYSSQPNRTITGIYISKQWYANSFIPKDIVLKLSSTMYNVVIVFSYQMQVLQYRVPYHLKQYLHLLHILQAVFHITTP